MQWRTSVFIGWAAAIVVAGRFYSPSSPTSASEDPVLFVPSASGAIDLDGDADESAWTDPPGPARTGPFVARGGAPAVPHAEARFVWSPAGLYVLLYAADADLEAGGDGPVAAGDAFRLCFAREGGDLVVDVSAAGRVTESVRGRDGTLEDAREGGVLVSREMDGTLDDASDVDEEWLVEMVVPFAALGVRGERGEVVPVSIRRHEVALGRPDTWSHWDRHRLVLN